MTPEDQQVEELLKRAIDRWIDSEPVAIVTGRMEVFSMIVAIQTVLANTDPPEIFGEVWRQMSTGLIEHLADDPDIYNFLMAGFNRDLDTIVPRTQPTRDVRLPFGLETRSGSPRTEEQPVVPADATATDASCKKCGRTFVDDGKFVDSAARFGQTPFCRTCVGRCGDSEIADHWCEIDRYRRDQGSAPSEPDRRDVLHEGPAYGWPIAPPHIPGKSKGPQS